MREDTNFKGSDLSCPSIYFLFYAWILKFGVNSTTCDAGTRGYMRLRSKHTQYSVLKEILDIRWQISRVEIQDFYFVTFVERCDHFVPALQVIELIS